MVRRRQGWVPNRISDVATRKRDLVEPDKKSIHSVDSHLNRRMSRAKPVLGAVNNTMDIETGMRYRYGFAQGSAVGTILVALAPRGDGRVL